MASYDMSAEITLQQLRTRLSSDGQLLRVIDAVSVQMPELTDMPITPCNRRTFHEIVRSIDSGLMGQLRGYDMGVDEETTLAERFVEPTIMLAGTSKVDRDKILDNGGQAMRSRLDVEYQKGMVRNCQHLFWQGNRTTNPLEPNGILERTDYNDLDSEFVIDNADGDASATANKTAIVMIQRGSDQVHLVRPDNGAQGPLTEAGIDTKDLGEQLVKDVSNRTYLALCMWFQLRWGIAIEDPRCIRAIRNISVTGDVADGEFPFDENKLIELVKRARTINNGAGAMIYMPLSIDIQMAQRINAKANVWGTVTTPFGEELNTFWGIPIRQTDGIPTDMAPTT